MKSLGIGALFGAIVLGALGRAALALVAVTSGYPANLSFAGLVEVMILGALLGALGGLFLPLLRRSFTGYVGSGLVAGAIVLTPCLLLGWWSERGPEPRPVLALTLATVVLLCLVWGVVSSAMYGRCVEQR